MLSFNDMPAHSRVWIYQWDRELTDAEIGEIKQRAAMFLIDWTSHGNLMRASIDVLYHRFILVLADEAAAAASGCGVDKSVRFVQQLEQDYKVSLFDRMLTAYRDADGKIQTLKLHYFEQLVQDGKLNGQTVVFNNLVSTKAELEKNWEVPMHKSWHARMIPA